MPNCRTPTLRRSDVSRFCVGWTPNMPSHSRSKMAYGSGSVD